MARFAFPELFTTAPSLSSACDAGRGSSVLSKWTATRSGSPYTGPCRSLFRFVRHGASPVAFLLRDVSHKASSGNNLTASTRKVARLIAALRSPNYG